MPSRRQAARTILDAEGIDPEVREFAEQMVEDHTKAAEQLDSAARTAGVTVPSESLSREATKLEQLEASTEKQTL